MSDKRITATDIIKARENPPPLPPEVVAAHEAAVAAILRPITDRMLALLGRMG